MMGFDPAVEAEVARIGALALQGLRDAWPARFGARPRLKSPDLLRRTLAWRLQAEAYGGLDADTRKLLAKGAVRPRGVVAQTGVRLVREWKGERHEAEVVDGAVIYRGERYASLSEVARVITGVRWNGPRFFGLRGAT